MSLDRRYLRWALVGFLMATVALGGITTFKNSATLSTIASENRSSPHPERTIAISRRSEIVMVTPAEAAHLGKADLPFAIAVSLAFLLAGGVVVLERLAKSRNRPPGD